MKMGMDSMSTGPLVMAESHAGMSNRAVNELWDRVPA